MSLDEQTQTPPDSGAKTKQTVAPAKESATPKKQCSKFSKWTMRFGIGLVVLVLLAGGLYLWWYKSQESQAIEQAVPPDYKELVAQLDAAVSDGTEHPIDDALRTARATLLYMRENIHDYTATMSKQLRLDGVLRNKETMFCKIRNRKMNEAKEVVVPLSVYLNFVEPHTGREVIWVENQNGGKLLAHNPGVFEFIPVPPLDPNGRIAMIGQRYPITEIGIENLMVELIKKGLKERQFAPEDCVVTKAENTTKEGRPCTMFEIRHPGKQLPEMDFYFARIYIDDEQHVPFFYEAFIWPETEGGEPRLQDRFQYADLKFNVKLTDMDFDTDNPDYGF